jgi:hypothetical protein
LDEEQQIETQGKQTAWDQRQQPGKRTRHGLGAIEGKGKKKRAELHISRLRLVRDSPHD